VIIAVAIPVVLVAATIVAVKNAVGGKSSKTRIVVTNATNAVIAAINTYNYKFKLAPI
jgi:hypothetical protein